MKQDQLENLVKRSLEGLEPEVPAHLWEGISSRITTGAAPGGQSAPAKGNWTGIAFKAGAAAVIISATAWWFWQSSDNSGLPENNKEVAVSIPRADVAGSSDQADRVPAENEAVELAANEEGATNATPAGNESDSFGQNTEQAVKTTDVVQEAPQNEVEEVVNNIEKNTDLYESTDGNQSGAEGSEVSSRKTMAGVQPSDAVEETDESVVLEHQEDTPAFAFVEVGILASAVSGEAPLTINFSNVTEAKFYDWNFGNGNKSQVATPEVTFDRAGDYQVHLTVTDFEGNLLHDVMEISVYEAAEVFIPTSFSPNGDGLNDYFFVEGKNLENLQFKVFRIDGSVVFESKSPGDRWDGNDTQQPEGRNYSVVVTGIKPNGDPLLEAEKLFVRRDQ